MKDDSKVYIATLGKAVAPVAVSGSLKNLFENLGAPQEDRKPFFADFKEGKNTRPVEIGELKLKIHCLRLKDQPTI